MKIHTLLILALTLFASCVDGTHDLYSPDKNIRVEILLPAESNQNTLQFNVYKHDSLISANNKLGVQTNSETGLFHQNIRVLSFRQFYIDNVIEVSSGTEKHQANGIRFMLANFEGANMDVVFRIYNKAVAYQYELYNDSLDRFMDEFSQFSIDPVHGIAAFALSDSLIKTSPISVRDNRAFVKVTESKNIPLPPRYTLPWRYLHFNVNSSNTAFIEERLLANTEYAY